MNRVEAVVTGVGRIGEKQRERLKPKRKRLFIKDGFVKSRKMPFSVIPVKTGIQSFQALLDSRLSILRSRATAEDGRGSDDCGDFLRDRHH